MDIKDNIYPYDEFVAIIEDNYWGNDIPDGIDGADAIASAAAHGFKIVGNLNHGVRYIFRWDLARTKLIPGRVSMSLKTLANCTRGHRLYGFDRILAEVLN